MPLQKNQITSAKLLICTALTRKNPEKWRFGVELGLARRCLQGIIRDFWQVKPGRLVDEIDAIRERIDPLTWDAIDALRRLGNIGAHMEKDINFIIDVDPGEAELLIGLVETLLRDWYIQREERKVRMGALVAAAAGKKAK